MTSTARTLIQWHTRTTSGWISMKRWSVPIGPTLHLSPRRGRALVLQHDAALEELLTDAVSFGELLVAAGGLARGNALGDPLFANPCGPRLQERLRLALQESQHAAERLELTRRFAVALERLVGELVQLGDGLGRAEVVVHGGFAARGVRVRPVGLGFPSPDLLHSRIETAQRLLGVVEVGLRVVDRAAVVRAHNEVAHHLGVVALEDLANGEEVAERLGHLRLVDAHEAVVHP